MLTWRTTIDKNLPINNYQPNEVKYENAVIGRILDYDPVSGVVIYETSNLDLFIKINNFGIGKMQCSSFSYEDYPKIKDIKDANEFGRQLGMNNPTIHVINHQGKEEPLDLSKVRLIKEDKNLTFTEEDMLKFAWFLVKNGGQTTDDKYAHFKDKFYLNQWLNKNNMATIYEIKIKLVSPWVNLDELSMKDIFMNFLKKFKHHVFKNLKFENIEIDVIRK